MDALKGSSRNDESAEEAAGAAGADAPAAAWGFADKEGFSVEDLLDLEEFCDGEGEADAKDVPDEHEAPPANAAAPKQDRSNNDGSQQSVVSFDLAPPAPEIVDLPVRPLTASTARHEYVAALPKDFFFFVPCMFGIN
jgi:hypothetical protein